jgi:hypothetical protein
MSLRVVGAGLGRTGTHSLKLALERLLGEPCYHMIEVFDRPDDPPVWLAAARGEMPDWDSFLAGYGAAVDWPSCSFWRELSAAYPDALVLLSVRDSADAWWKSANETIFEGLRSRERPGGQGAMPGFPEDIFAARFTSHWMDEDAAKAAYERHNADVRASAPPERFLEWSAREGWAPICKALDLPVPEEPFPHVNTTDEFLARRRQREEAMGLPESR